MNHASLADGAIPRRPSLKRRDLIVTLSLFVIFNIIYHQYSNASSMLDIVYDEIWNDHDQTTLDKVIDFNSPEFMYVVPPNGISPPALPSIQTTDEEEEKIKRLRTGYGGTGDKSHLGGFTSLDPMGISPDTWKDMMEYFGIKSLLDVGCGKGVSTSWFYLQGIDTICVEGSHDGIMNSWLPEVITEKRKQENDHADEVSIKKEIEHRVVEHDFSRGPWWPKETVDAVWCVEVLEHIGRNFQKNYLPSFKKAAFIFATHSNWGGWHHTEVHDDDWWINRFSMYGFVFSEQLTNRVRDIANSENGRRDAMPHDETVRYNAQHVWTSMMVFINPAVASRQEHSHLMAEPGCFVDRKKPNAHCGEEPNPRQRAVSSPIPEEFKFIPFKKEMQLKWEELLVKKL